MVKFIHRVTGIEIEVSEDRKQEYLDRGHELVKEVPEKPKRKKRTAKKGA